MKAKWTLSENFRFSLRGFMVWAALRVLNRWLNPSPCRYGFINNIDAFSLEYLTSEAQGRPDLTVAQLLRESAHFQEAMKTVSGTGLTVIEGDSVREATVWDLHELRNLGRKDGSRSDS